MDCLQLCPGPETNRCSACAGLLVWLQRVALGHEHIGACLVLAFGLATASCTGPGTYWNISVLVLRWPLRLATVRCTGPGTYRCLSCVGLWSGYSNLHWAWNIPVLVLRWPLVWLQQVALGLEHTGACLVLAFGLATAGCSGLGTYRRLSCAGLIDWRQHVTLGQKHTGACFALTSWAGDRTACYTRPRTHRSTRTHSSRRLTAYPPLRLCHGWLRHSLEN